MPTTSLTTINSLDCIVNRKNTGFGKCAFSPGLIKKAILVPIDSYLIGPDSAYAQLIRGMVESKSQRYFPLGMFIEFTDQSSQAGSQTFNYGASLTTNDGIPKWMFQFTNGKHCFYQKALSFHDSQDFYGVYFIDHKNQLMGVEDTVTISSTTYTVLRPFTMSEIAVQNWTPGNSGAIPKYTMSFTFEDTQEYRERLAFVDLTPGGKYTNLKGLQDVELSIEDLDTAVYGITALLNCSGQNLGEYLGDEFADASLWSVLNASGNGVTIDSVAWNPTTGEYELTLDDADPDYTGVLTFSLATADAIYTANGLLYESDTVTADAS